MEGSQSPITCTNTVIQVYSDSSFPPNTALFSPAPTLSSQSNAASGVLSIAYTANNYISFQVTANATTAAQYLTLQIFYTK